MLALAGLYISLHYFFEILIYSDRVDGLFGMLLGLYICSHPAANVLDILLFMKPEIREGLITSNQGRFWLLLNLLTFLAAWVVVFAGILRFVSGSN